mgnify:CR=1 FL=1
MIMLNTPLFADNATVVIGDNYAYTFLGNDVLLEADLNVTAANSCAVNVQLWACTSPFEGGVLQGVKVAEASCGVLTENKKLSETVPAYAPAGQASYFMVLVLVSKPVNQPETVISYANFAQTQQFLLPRMSGKITCDIQQEAAEVRIDAIENPRASTNLSGTLALELWSLSQKYNGASFNGVKQGGVLLGTLLGQNSWQNNVIHIHLASKPIVGEYVVLMLREWVGNGYITGNARAVACLKTCNSFTDIYITRSDSKTTKANALVVFRDASGYNGNLPGNTSLQDTKILAKAEANYSFNGVCFSPGTNLTPLDFYVSANAIACNGGSTLGTVVAFGGIEPYTKTPDNNYTAGSYPFQVTDASGCSVSRNYLFVQPTALKIQKCYLSSRKILGMKASGGTAPYVYTIDAGASYQQPNAQNNTARAYSNKNGGIYTIGVKDANNCVYFETVNTNSLPSCPTAMTQNVLSIELKQIPGQKYIHVNALYDEQVSVQCAIYNLNGQLILSKNLRTNQWTQIDFPFKPGSYSILIKYQDQVATKTFVE